MESFPMDEAAKSRTRRLFEIFKMAVEDERRAQRQYKEALSLCDDPDTARLLEQLYEDEVRHEQDLMERYNELRSIHRSS
jgi:rubrerythrin